MTVGYQKAELIQLGQQSVFDTAVAATFKYRGMLTFNENIENYEPDYPQGVRGQTINQMSTQAKGWTGEYEADLTAEELITFLDMGFKGGVTASGAMADKTWTYLPPPAANPSPKPYTLEYAVKDFSTSWARQVPNVYCSQIVITIPQNGPAKMKCSLFGGAVVSGHTMTAALSYLSGLEIVPGGKFKLYVDDAAGSIGGTQKTATLLNGEITLMAGIRPDATIDGRTNLDYSQVLFEDVAAEAKLLVNYNAFADAELTKWRTRASRYVQLKAIGATLGGSNRSIQIDLPCEYVAGQQVGRQANANTLALALKAKYDATIAGTYKVTVVNARTALS